MKNSDIKFGNVIELDNGERYFKTFINNKECFICLNVETGHLKNLIFKSNNFFNKISKVYKDYTCSELLWVLKPKLNETEINLLRSFYGLGMRYIKRDEDKDIWVGKVSIPLDRYTSMFRDIFNELEIDKRYSIEYLLKDGE